jgi:hypothetical protein
MNTFMSIFNKKFFVSTLLLFLFFSFGFFISVEKTEATSLGKFICNNMSNDPDYLCDLNINISDVSNNYPLDSFLDIQLSKAEYSYDFPDEVKFNGVFGMFSSCGGVTCAKTYNDGGSSEWVTSSTPGCYNFPIYFKWNDDPILGSAHEYTVNILLKVGNNNACGLGEGSTIGNGSINSPADGTEVYAGADFTINWSTQNFMGCVIVDQDNNTIPDGQSYLGGLNGSLEVEGISNETTYSLICDNRFHTQTPNPWAGINKNNFLAKLRDSLPSVINKAFGTNYPFYYSKVVDSVTVSVVSVSIQEPGYQPGNPGPTNGEDGPYLVPFQNQPTKFFEVQVTGMGGATCTIKKSIASDPWTLIPNGTWTVSGNTPNPHNFPMVVEPNFGQPNYKAECTKNSTTESDTDIVKVTSPDLTAINIVVPPNPTVGFITLEATIKNQGNVISTPGVNFHNLFQKSTSQNFSSGVTDLSPTIIKSNLAENGQINISGSYYFPTAGDFWVRACADKSNQADPDGTIDEYGNSGGNENNNCSIPSPIQIENPLKPDLIALETSPATGFIGASIQLTATVKNQGTASTGTGFNNLFQTATGFDDGGAPIGLVNRPVDSMTSALNVGSSANISKYATFSNAGVYYLRACADKNNATDPGLIDEGGNENNNCSNWTILTISSNIPHPNLIAYSSTPNTAMPNELITFSVVIENIGTVPTGVSPFNNFFQIATEDPGGNGGGGGFTKIKKRSFFARIFPRVFAGSGTITNLSPVQLGPLGENVSGTITSSYTFVSSGIYFVRACADKSNPNDNGIVSESNEGDNCGEWGMVIVEIKLPNLESEYNGPNQVNTNVEVKLTATVINSGNVSTGIKFNNLFQVKSNKKELRKNASFFFKKIFAEENVENFPTGEVGPVEGDKTLVVVLSHVFKDDDSGVKSVRFCADKASQYDLGVIPEKNEDDNCSDWETLVVSSGNVPPNSYQCSDGIDNDGDGKTDSADSCCDSPTDNTEDNSCGFKFPRWIER